jgi:hypothetical protein
MPQPFPLPLRFPPLLPSAIVRMSPSLWPPDLVRKPRLLLTPLLPPSHHGLRKPMICPRAPH